MKKILWAVLVVSLISALSIAVFAKSYTDISGHWAEDCINEYSKQNVVNGYEDNSFRPDNNITRAEYVTILVRLFEPTHAIDLSQYKDVERGAWYYEYLAKAVNLGAIQGDSDSIVRPNDNVTRQEAVVILNRIMLLASKNVNTGKFSDYSRVASWAKEAVNAFISEGYLQGYNDGTLKPTGYITRAEAIKILSKAIALVITEPGTYDLSKVDGNVLVKAKNVTLTNDEGKRIYALNDTIRDSMKLDSVKKDDVILISEIEKASEESRARRSSQTTETSAKIVLTPNGNVYDITKEGNVEIAEGQKVTVVVKDGNKENVIVKNKEINEGNLSSFKSAFKSAIGGTLDADLVLQTVNDVYGEDAVVRTFGKNTIDTLDEETRALAYALVDASNGEFTIMDVYEVLDMSAEDVAKAAIDELTYPEAIQLMEVIKASI